jgi:hypothetical protein
MANDIKMTENPLNNTNTPDPAPAPAPTPAPAPAPAPAPVTTPSTDVTPVTTPSNQEVRPATTPVEKTQSGSSKQLSILEQIYTFLFLDSPFIRLFVGRFGGQIGHSAYLLTFYRIMIILSGIFVTLLMKSERGTYVYLVIATWVAYLSYSLVLVDTYP